MDYGYQYEEEEEPVDSKIRNLLMQKQQEQTTPDTNWLDTILGWIGPSRAEAADPGMQAKALYGKPKATPEPIPESPPLFVDHADLVKRFGPQVHIGGTPTPTKKYNTQASKSPKDATDAIPPSPFGVDPKAVQTMGFPKTNKVDVAPPVPKAPKNVGTGAAPHVQNLGVNQPGTAQLQNLSGSSAKMGKTTITEQKDLTGAIQAIRESAAASQKAQEAEAAGLPQMAEEMYKWSVDQHRASADNFNRYLGRLDANQKGAFWQNMVKALGQVAAGVTGLATKLDVPKHYKPLDLYDKDAADKIAGEELKLREANTAAQFKAVADKLKIDIEHKKMMETAPLKAQAKVAAEIARMISENAPMTRTTTTEELESGTKQNIANIPAEKPAGSGGGGGGGTTKYTEISGQVAPEEIAKQAVERQNEFDKKSEALKNFTPPGATEPERAKSYAAYASKGTKADPRTLAGIYMWQAARNPGADPREIVRLSNDLYKASLQYPNKMDTEEDYEWFHFFMEELPKQIPGYKPALPWPTMKKIRTRGDKDTLPDLMNPYDSDRADAERIAKAVNAVRERNKPKRDKATPKPAIPTADTPYPTPTPSPKVQYKGQGYQ